jgi:hypothetical protein
MAEGKKGVLIYADWIKKFEALKDEEAGRLIKHLFRYINDLNPEFPDRITELSFIDIELTLKRDLIKWEQKAEKSRLNGLKGGRPITQANPEEPKITQQVISEPKEPVIVNVNVNDSVNVNVNDTVIKEKEEGDKSPPPKTLEEREESFRLSLTEFVEEFSKETVRAFFFYWSEKNPKGLKMRFEMEKTFEIKKRLTTWKNKESQFAPKNNSFGNDKPKQTTFDKLRDAGEEARRIREERRAKSDSNGEESDFAQYTPVD